MVSKSTTDLMHYPQFHRSFPNCPMEFECGTDWHEFATTYRSDVRCCKTADKICIYVMINVNCMPMLRPTTVSQSFRLGPKWGTMQL
jgi:hypothetical protein